MENQTVDPSPGRHLSTVRTVVSVTVGSVMNQMMKTTTAEGNGLVTGAAAVMKMLEELIFHLRVPVLQLRDRS
ncbi:unnamed protein product [Ophioblennius macclurei]